MSVKRLHHVQLKVRDLEGTRAFAKDFGLVEVEERAGRVYLRGAGNAAYHLVLEAAAESSIGAIAFETDTPADHARHGEAVALDAPGGGQSVALTDPEGNRILLVHGIEQREADVLPAAMIFNQGVERGRLGVGQARPPLGPPPLLGLGHVGLFIRDWRACDAWYRDKIGLIPSDLLYAGNPDNVIGGFYRLDRCAEWVDHHIIAFFQMGKSDLHHISFEVQNPEAQFMGHRWMTQRQHEAIWGVGRHPLGSHVFDVWRDPSGYRFETFSDTDLCTADIPPAKHSIADASMDLWSDRDVDAYFA